MNRRRALAFLVTATSASQALAAAPASYDVSLVAGGEREGFWYGGLSVRLQPDWKTYWKMPGDAGIPPSFDWKGSVNAKSINVLYPVPGRFRDASGETIGYHNEVVFPVQVEPQDRNSPINLQLGLLFAVCREICIPAQAELSLATQGAPADARVWAWLNKVPRHVRSGEAGIIIAARIEKGAAGPRLVLSLFGTPQDIFIDGGDGAYFGKPEHIASTSEFALPIANIRDAGKLAGARLAVTVAYADKAFEQQIVLP